MKSLSFAIILLLIILKIGATVKERRTFCRQGLCLTCVGRYCTTTCKGEDCEDCPTGDCCDKSSCNICRGEKCCSTHDCNVCIVDCLKTCQGAATCHYDCFQQCLPNGGSGWSGGNQTGSNISKLITNKNYIPVNVTTTINITNTIHNENSVHNPIYINTTNINNNTGHQNYHKKNVLIETKNDNNDTSNQKCCEVVHPEKCQAISNPGERLCYIKKHNECSSLCVSKHVHIVEDRNQTHPCVQLAEQPYWYCGRYRAENCDECYVETDPEEIEVASSDCSEICRAALISEEFYNKLYIRDA